MRCPNCNEEMDSVVNGHWVGDVCPSCSWEEPYKSKPTHERLDGFADGFLTMVIVLAFLKAIYDWIVL